MDSILDMLNEKGNITVSELAEEFGISEVTIRSDLTGMERAGLLRRIHGGAISTRRASYELSHSDRMELNKDAKIRIAKACVDLVKDGDALMIDYGTTTRYLARELAERGNLTVVTNALLVAQELIYNRSVNVLLLGGNLDLQYQFTFGNDTVAQIQRYRADKAIISADGVTSAHGITTYHHQDVELCRLMIERSNEVIVIADHSKIGKEGFSNITGICGVDILVTNKCDDSKAELDALRGKGIVVMEV